MKKSLNKNRWKNFRNRWCYLNGKKVKLRKYIVVRALQMKAINKAGFEKVDHLQNFKAALNLYGFAGVQIYEDYFFKDIPLPADRSWLVKLGLKLAPYYAKVLNFLKWYK